MPNPPIPGGEPGEPPIPGRREQILEAVLAALQEVEGLAVSRAMRHVEEVESFPFAAPRWAGEKAETAATAGPSGKKTRLELGLVLYVRSETPLEDMLKLFNEMERKLEANPALGMPWPCFARLEAFEMVNASRAASEDGAERFGIGEVLLVADYRHARGNP